jgi:hypothetical protein
MLYEFIFEPAPRLRQHRRKVGFGSFTSFWLSTEYFRSTPMKQTFSVSDGMSQTGQERTHALQQIRGAS